MSKSITVTPLATIPNMAHVNRADGDSGYEYPDEYQNKLFSFDGKLIIFDKRVKHEIPLEFINIISQLINDDFASNDKLQKNIENIRDLIDNVENKLVSRQNELSSNLLDVTEVFNRMQSEFVTKINLNSDEQISEIQNQLLILEEKISSIKKNNKEVDQLVNNFKETINDLVDQKLVDVYKNFQSVVSKLVTDEVEKIRINIEANANKLKPAQIAIYKEMGLSIEHIIELKKSNLI